MPHGRVRRLGAGFLAMRQFGIIEASGNDKAWWIADRIFWS
jgi:hypothetical protein